MTGMWVKGPTPSSKLLGLPPPSPSFEHWMWSARASCQFWTRSAILPQVVPRMKRCSTPPWLKDETLESSLGWWGELWIEQGESKKEHVPGSRRAHPNCGASYVYRELGDEVPLVGDFVAHQAKIDQPSFSFRPPSRYQSPQVWFLRKKSPLIQPPPTLQPEPFPQAPQWGYV